MRVFLNFHVPITQSEKRDRLDVSCGFCWVDAGFSSSCIESVKISELGES